jgi:hypothetical protein
VTAGRCGSLIEMSFRHTKKKKNFTTEDTEGTEKNSEKSGFNNNSKKKEEDISPPRHQGSKNTKGKMVKRETVGTWGQQQQ